MTDHIKEPFYSLMYEASEGWNDHLWQVPPELLQKYSDLIVRECARIDSEANNPDHEDGVTYNQTILEHFGVKE